MLVLHRKSSEVVRIEVPPSAEVQFIDVAVVHIHHSKSRVKLGFEAKKEVIIRREEVYAKIAAAEAARLAGEGEQEKPAA